MDKKKHMYTYDKQEIRTVAFKKKKFLKEAKKFFIDISDMQKDDILYVVKAAMNKQRKVVTRGTYYGVETSPLSFLVNSKYSSEEVFLGEAHSMEAIYKFLMTSKENNIDENIYIFKVLYQDYTFSKIESLYGGVNELDFYIFERDDAMCIRKGKVLKRFGEVDYSPSLNYF